MDLNVQNCLVMFKIPVVCKNRQAVAMGEGADQEIRARSLYAF
jgi:hypothetical protein